MKPTNKEINREAKKSVIHIQNVREFELEKIDLLEEFDILQIAGEGWFGKILLVEHRGTHTEMILKALPKPYVTINDFYREFHFSLCLGAHKNIVTTYDIAFETNNFYLFSQEYATLGDLTSNLTEIGIGEKNAKRVAKQIACALEFIHLNGIVHRDVKLDNILVFRSNFSKVKLCDFGESRMIGSTVLRRNEWLPYAPPEVIQTAIDNSYKTDPSQDIWQFAIVVFICLTGCLPWQKASVDDPRYHSYVQWQSSSFPLHRQPKLFKLITPKACKMFKKFLEPQIAKRVRSLRDVFKYLNEKWLGKSAEKELLLLANDQDRMCPSMFSFHSSAEEKNKLLNALAKHGIETTVDRVAKKKRIKDWIQASTIAEELEEEDEDNGLEDSLTSPSSFVPVGRNFLPNENRKFIDPRTGIIINEHCQQFDEYVGYQNCREPIFFENKLVSYDNFPKIQNKNRPQCKTPKDEVMVKAKNIREHSCCSPKIMCKCSKVQEVNKRSEKEKEYKKSSITESILKVKEKSAGKASHGRRVNIITKKDSPIIARKIVVTSDLIDGFKSDESSDECECSCQKNNSKSKARYQEEPVNDFDTDSIFDQKNSDFDSISPDNLLKGTPYEMNMKHIRIYKKYNHS